MKSDPRTAQIPSSNFSAFLPAIREDLIENEIFTPKNHLIARTIIDFLNFSNKVTIHDQKYHSGWTRPMSNSEIASQSGYSTRTVTRAISEMIDKGILERKKRKHSDVCFSYRFKAYDRLHQHLEENPASDTVSPSESYKFRDDTMSKGDDTLSSNQEFLEKEEDPTSLGTRTGIADPMPTEEGGGNSETSQKAESTVPAAVPGPGTEEQKNSLREKEDLSLSPKLLAQEFHDLFGPEEPTEKLINVSALDFFRRADDGTQTGILYDLMRDEKLIERFPDSSARAHTSVAVVRAAFKIVLKTCDEWGEIKSPRFLNTPTGQRAISKARTAVCRPSLEIDPDTEPATKPLSDVVESLQSDSESGEEQPEESHTEEKQSSLPRKNAAKPAWQRDHSKVLPPNVQAVLDRVMSGTPPPGMDKEPGYKQPKPLRSAKQ